MNASVATSEDRHRQYLTFKLADEEYAIGVLRVKEIIRFETVTVVPSAPPYVRGVINLRGGVVPVVDLAVKFGGQARSITKWSCIVIVEVPVDGLPTIMGILADAVDQVVELSDHDIEPPPKFGTRVRMDFLHGMGRNGEKFLLLLDIERVLSQDEIVDVEAACAPEQEAGGEPGEGADEAVLAAEIASQQPEAAEHASV